ncbi:MAG: bifunctional 5,10-methylenetetrahydrofolate dehydrogenase/5,10-methenyltetrahydrofolate cyclohydrolase [Planctomycetes bacterium]|nr:bifunctional 5,10-methylenetetrahydrofolate dehydrogenase/5,10-methenyltetrahydrofolate cyclohydrolase [Planctomycetota bacterium]
MDGRLLARKITLAVAEKVGGIRNRTGVTPTLATVIVGDDPASHTYVRMKRKRCEDAGIASITRELAATATTDEVIAEIKSLADDDSVHGILVQHPVPNPIDRRAVFEAIPIAKDVDGVTSATLGRMILGMPAFVPCTPRGIMALLDEYSVDLDGAHAVVIGRSPILGRPMASLLINRHATVTLCHSRTRNLSAIVRHADILIAALGKPKFVQGDWIKPGAVVIDAGYNPGNGGIIGDVDFDEAIEPCSLITPVPGGVGPMTIAMLIDQTTQAAATQLGVEL